MKTIVVAVTVLAGTLATAVPIFGQMAGELSPPEQQALSDTVQYALENNKTHQSSDWVNPDTGNSGGIVPVRTFTGADKGPCREFISTIIIAGQQQQGYGTACRQPDGSWQIVADESTDVQAPPAAAQNSIYVNNPPRQYYYYPADFYYPYHIYLSFGYVYRGGHAFRGSYFLDGRSFRHRHPIHIRERIYISPRDLGRHHWQEHRAWKPKVERGGKHWRGEDRKDRRGWQDRSHWNKDRSGRNR